MSHSNGVIRRPVDIKGDIAAVLGVTTARADLATLCRNLSRINKWSKHKPVTHSDSYPYNDPKWYRGSDGKCGLNITLATASTWQGIAARYTGGNNGWMLATISGKYRALDFDGYDHNAEPMLRDFDCATSVQQGNDITFAVDESSEVTSLDRTDILIDSVNAMSEYYFGVAIFNSSNVAQGRVTSSSPTDLQCSYNTAGLVSGTYTAYPFVCRSRRNQNDSESAQNYYTLPNVTPRTFTVTSAPVSSQVSVDAYATKFGNTINIEVYITVTGSAINLSNNTCLLRFLNSSVSSGMQAGEQTWTIGALSLAVGQQTLTHTFTLSGSYITRMYKVIVSLDGGRYTCEVEVEESEDEME